MSAPNAKIRELLLAKRSELARELMGGREEIRVERTADPIDFLQANAHRHVAALNLDRRWETLRNIRCALARIESGEYGTCVHCGKAIRPQRLAAVPWAQLCIQCQDKADRRDPEVLEALEAA